MPRFRTTYPKELKSEAKRTGRGLVTISIIFPNGEKMEEQGTASVVECMFAKWAAAMLLCEEVRDLPDLQAFVKERAGDVASHDDTEERPLGDEDDADLLGFF